MSDNFIRHLIAFCGLLVAVIIFIVGYSSAQLGWWWVGFGTIFVYVIVYSLVDA